jgi:serine/threonine protein kinase
MMLFLYFSFANQYSLGAGFLFSIVLVPRYKLSLCHTIISNLIYLAFRELVSLYMGYVITMFTSLLYYAASSIGGFLLVKTFHNLSFSLQIKREISIMKLVRHPYVVRLHELWSIKG